jgi:hypothetical protein
MLVMTFDYGTLGSLSLLWPFPLSFHRDAGKFIPQQAAKLSEAEQLICSRQTSHKQQKRGDCRGHPL